MNKKLRSESLGEDTIAAISTPLGEGGLGIVRISGKETLSIADKIFKGKVLPSKAQSHTANHGIIIDPQTNEIIDEVILTVMLSPKSYTTEDMVEISCHGGSFVLYKVLQQALNAGARLANPGEFTLRAFLNGRIDLTQAEAVAEVIKAKTDLSLKVAMDHLKGELSEKLNLFREKLIELLAQIEVQIDFPEEDIQAQNKESILKEIDIMKNEINFLIETYDEGKILKDGLRVVIVGRPNVGKSSLLNAFLKEERAIVTPIPGTTRDVISETANFKGVPVRLIDTAGFRVSKDRIEAEGVKRTKLEINKADMILWVIDSSQKLDKEEFELEKQIKNFKHVVVLNKEDLADEAFISELEKRFKSRVCQRVSALKLQGIEELKQSVASNALILDKDMNGDVMLSSLRHKEALLKAEEGLKKAKMSLDQGMSFEFVALDLRIALDSIGEIIGKTVTDDILNKIFSEFCVGK
jgi:tRNA modification GTPase